MKINWKVRLKNPFFWIGLGAIIITAMGADPEMFTSWQIVKEQFIELVSNPFMLVTVALAVIGYIQDPTTKGLSDGVKAINYKTPAPNCKQTGKNA